jgi:hypothetical protein
MESQYPISQCLLPADSNVFSLEIVDQRLQIIYADLIAIEFENTDVKFNKNISFVNKLTRDDPLFAEGVKVVHISDSILKNKDLTTKEITKIATEYTRLKIEQISRNKQLDQIFNIIKTTKNMDVFLNALTAASYYNEFHENLTFETTFGVYIVGAIIEKQEGLKAVYFKPEGQFCGVSPILSIRGTMPGHSGNALDDLEPSIGLLAFEAGKEELLELLKLSFSQFPQGCLILGHSLGGAIAQQIAKAFVNEGLIAQVYHYNAPGIGPEAASKFTEDCVDNENPPEIIEVRHTNDILSYFGGKHLPPAKRIFLKEKLPASYTQAHEILNLMEKTHLNLVDVEITKTPEELNFWQGRFNYFTIETLRWTFAPILRLIVNAIFPAEKSLLLITNVVAEDATSEEELFLQKHRF